MGVRFTVAWVAAAGLLSGYNSGHSSQVWEVPYDAVAAQQHIIPMKDAAAYTRNFRQAREALYARHSELKGQLGLPLSESFNRDAIAALLNAKDSGGNPAAGVRVYFGQGDDGQTRLVLVPYDARGNDIITRLSPETEQRGVGAPGGDAASAVGGEAVEDGKICPPTCSTDSTSALGGP